MAGKQRRDKGSGSIYQDAQGIWWAALIINGKLRRRRAASRKAAQEKLKELQTLQQAGIDVTRASMSVNAFFNRWHEDVLMRRTLRDTTKSYYRTMIELHILRHIGDLRLDAVRFEDIQQWVDTLPVSMAQRVYSIANDAFGWAVRRRYIRFNPCDDVILPHYAPKAQRAWMVQEIAQLLQAAPSHYHLFYATLYTLGLRLGEALGLQWADVDWDKGTIHIARQVQEIVTPDGRTTLETDLLPKTDAGVRTIPLPPRLLSHYSSVYEHLQQVKDAQGVTWLGHGPLFPDSKGGFYWPHNISKRFREHRAAAGIDKALTLHQFRHTCASWLDEAGATESVKASILGHAKQDITLRYTHASIEAMRRVLARMEQEQELTKLSA